MKNIAFTALLLALVVAACGDDGGNNANSVLPPNNTNNANSTNNVNSTTNNANSTNNTNNVNPDEGCRDFDTLSEIPAGEDVIEREFDDIVDYARVSCDGEEEPTGSYLYKLQVEELTEVTVVVDGIPKLSGEEIIIPPQPLVEVRSDACGETRTVDSCREDRLTTFVMQPNEPYYLAINGRLDSGGFRLQFGAQTLICDPNQPPTCTDGQISLCAGTTEDIYKCAGDCIDADTCAGDACDDNVVEIRPLVGGEPIIVEGSRAAYTSTWNAEDLPGCETNEGPQVTPHSETFLKVPGVRAGQTLTVDASDSDGVTAIFLLDSCAAEGCIAAGLFDANNENKLVYTAEADGDIIVVLEAGTPNIRTYSIAISLTQ